MRGCGSRQSGISLLARSLRVQAGSQSYDRRALLGGDPRLPLLPRHVDLDEDLRLGRAVPLELAQRRVGGDRVDELDVREDDLDLSALQLADEVPAELRVRGGLRHEVLRAVLPQELDP